LAEEGLPAAIQTWVHEETAKSVLTRNQSPDVPFDRSVNPYRGCEHGCIYCFARPTHTYLNHSAGLDFETQLYAKTNVVDALRRELSKPGYRPQPIAFGTNTDPYQPIERRYRLMRGILELLLECRHPLTIVTKGSALLERDLDLLSELARHRLVGVGLSVTTLDETLKRTLEPRASASASRLRLMRKLSDSGIPVMALVAPVIPAINDAELETILEAVRDHGAQRASYVLLRLPLEVSPLFREWLDDHFPERAAHVMSLVQQMRGGRDYDSDFSRRAKGEGIFAQLIAQRFRLACRRLGLAEERSLTLDTGAFLPPRRRDDGPQQSLF